MKAMLILFALLFAGMSKANESCDEMFDQTPEATALVYVQFEDWRVCVPVTEVTFYDGWVLVVATDGRKYKVRLEHVPTMRWRE